MIDPMITRRYHFTHQFANFFNFAFHHATIVLTFHIVITFISKRFDFLYQSYFIKSFIQVRTPKFEWEPRNLRQNIQELLTKISNASLILIELRNFACDFNMKPPFILQLHHSLSYNLCHIDVQIQFRFKSNLIGLIHLFHIIFKDSNL